MTGSEQKGRASVLTEMKLCDVPGLRDTTVPMRPLTVLIGPNGSGKSEFLAEVWWKSNGLAELVEGPENGVHPSRLDEVAQGLRASARGEYGRQVVCVTYSPYLLDHVDLKVDQVLVFQRNNDGSNRVDPVDTERMAGFLDEFRLGEVWSNEGEAGLVRKEDADVVDATIEMD